MDRAQKEQVVEELGQIFESSGVVVVARYEGMTVAEMQALRAQMRDAGGAVRVAKNRLAKIALEGKPAASIADYLTGMTVLAFSEDPVAAAKVADAYAKTNDKFVILGGAMGENALDPAGVKSVAQMPSREELIASIVAAIGAVAIGEAAEGSLVVFLFAIGALMGLQYLFTLGAARFDWVERLIKSKPAVLYDRGYCRDAMSRERVTENEIGAAIRENGLHDLSDVRWVILESDASFSVIAPPSSSASTMVTARR